MTKKVETRFHFLCLSVFPLKARKLVTKEKFSFIHFVVFSFLGKNKAKDVVRVPQFQEDRHCFYDNVWRYQNMWQK